MLSKLRESEDQPYNLISIWAKWHELQHVLQPTVVSSFCRNLGGEPFIPHISWPSALNSNSHEVDLVILFTTISNSHQLIELLWPWSIIGKLIKPEKSKNAVCNLIFSCARWHELQHVQQPRVVWIYRRNSGREPFIRHISRPSALNSNTHEVEYIILFTPIFNSYQMIKLHRPWSIIHMHSKLKESINKPYNLISICAKWHKSQHVLQPRVVWIYCINSGGEPFIRHFSWPSALNSNSNKVEVIIVFTTIFNSHKMIQLLWL